MACAVLTVAVLPAIGIVTAIVIGSLARRFNSAFPLPLSVTVIVLVRPGSSGRVTDATGTVPLRAVSVMRIPVQAVAPVQDSLSVTLLPVTDGLPRTVRCGGAGLVLAGVTGGVRGVGGGPAHGGGGTTHTVVDCCEVRPVGSVTVKVTVWAPVVANAWVTVAPVAVAPSSKDHA